MTYTRFYAHTTRIGTFYLARDDEKGWQIEFDAERVGGYCTAEKALDDVVGGHTWSLAHGVDTSTLGLPDELADWQRIRSP